MANSNEGSPRIRPWWKKADNHPVIRRLQKLLVRRAIEARRHASVRIFGLLGKFAEHSKVRAHVSAVYVSDGGSKLIPVALHNHGMETRGCIDIKEMGLVAKAARKREAIYAPDVSRNVDYFEISASTQSELVVPIFWEQEFLGVINLESRELDGLGTPTKEVLGATLPALIEELLVLKRLYDRKTWCPWHPRLHGWDLRSTFDELLAAAAGEVSDAAVSFTAWYADWEDREIFAYSTHAYDYEFKAKALPINDSEIGRKLQTKKAVVELNIDNFRELEKARTMGVEEAYLAPIRAKSDRKGKPTRGLACYFRGHGDACDPLDENDREIALTALAGMAKLCGSLIRSYRSMRLSLAISHLSRINTEYCLSGWQTRMEQWLHGLLTVFASKAGSIFMLDETGRTLNCVATTGFYEFSSSTRSFDMQAHSYDIENNSQAHTVRAHQANGQSILRNDLSRKIDETDMVRYEPLYWNAEFIEGEPLKSVENTSRKLLLCGFMADRLPVGVVRIVRGNEDRLFTRFEGKMLEDLCSKCVPDLGILGVGSYPIEAPEFSGTTN